MKLKNLVMLAAALTCIAGSTVMAEEKVGLKSASADSYEVVQVMTTRITISTITAPISMPSISPGLRRQPT